MNNHKVFGNIYSTFTLFATGFKNLHSGHVLSRKDYCVYIISNIRIIFHCLHIRGKIAVEWKCEQMGYHCL